MVVAIVKEITATLSTRPYFVKCMSVSVTYMVHYWREQGKYMNKKENTMSIHFHREEKLST
jgi:hypothetical protein